MFASSQSEEGYLLVPLRLVDVVGVRVKRQNVKIGDLELKIMPLFILKKSWDVKIGGLKIVTITLKWCSGVSVLRKTSVCVCVCVYMCERCLLYKSQRH